jgi:Mannosyltransferase (PIG-V)
VTAITLAPAGATFWRRWRPIAAWWAISRLVTLSAFGLLDLMGPRGHLKAAIYAKPLALLGSWDGVWYARVAQHGYLVVPQSQSDPAFFPLFPILLRGLRVGLGLGFTAGGALVANVSLLVAVVGFYELSVRVVGDVGVARRAACFVAVTPMAFVFSMSYPESFALALSVLALLAGFRGWWLWAAGLAAAAALARPEAAVVAVPLLWVAWRGRGGLDAVGRGRALAAGLAAPAAVASFPVYLQWALGDAGAWGQAQKAWGRSFNLLGPLHAFQHIPRKLGPEPVLSRDLAFLIVYALLLYVAYRHGIPRAWILGGALVLALPLFSGSLESEARFGLLALPVYWGLAYLTANRRTELAVRTGSLALLVGGVMLLPTLWP